VNEIMGVKRGGETSTLVKQTKKKKGQRINTVILGIPVHVKQKPRRPGRAFGQGLVQVTKNSF